MKDCPFCGSKPIFYGLHADGQTKVFSITHKNDCYFRNFITTETFYSNTEHEHRWNTRSIRQERLEKLNEINK